MTGWRLGWMLVPTELRRAVDRLTGNFTICPPVLPQYAAVAAFTPDAVAEAEEHLHHYAGNRETLLAGLRRLGITWLAPTDGVLRLRRRLRLHLRPNRNSEQLRLKQVWRSPQAWTSTPRQATRSYAYPSPGRANDIDQGLDRIGIWLGQSAMRSALRCDPTLRCDPA